MSMKVLLLVLNTLLVPVSARFRGGDGATTDGSVPHLRLTRSDGCTWANDPVTCADTRSGQRPRTFSSICFAAKAGFKFEDCRSTADPSSAVLSCAKVKDLVCGASNVPYANLCAAEMSGFSERDCVQRTSVVQRETGEANENSKVDNVFCLQVWIPVYCTLRGIEFSNLCEARTEGYSPEDCTVPADGSCPANLSNPVVCRGNSTYSNLCLSSVAGHIPSSECVASEGAVHPKSANCFKKAIYPVRCGKRMQFFDNFCLAKAAGFKRKKCTRVSSRARN